MKKQFFNRIIWAVDTLEPVEFQRNALFVIGALTRESDAQIYPVHVLSFPYVNSTVGSDFTEAYLALAEKRLKELGERSDLPNMHKGKVLFDNDGSTRKSVEHLLEYAFEKDADAVVASTHSRGAVSRLFMGSFAETLLLKSEIPVITVNPRTRVRERISKILYPTAFYEESRAGFERAVELSSFLGAGLTLYYKEPYIPLFEPSAELYKALDRQATEREQEANRCREWAKQFHVPLEIHMDKQPGNVAESIVSFASDHNFDLIAMVSETNDFEGPRVGAVCRNVVRAAECPVWTMKTGEGSATETA
jgi:nucleotide-binding universal stress UspA family protein